MIKKIWELFVWSKVKVLFKAAGTENQSLDSEESHGTITTVITGIAAGLVLTLLIWPVIKNLSAAVAMIVMLLTYCTAILTAVILLSYLCTKAVRFIIDYSAA